MKNKTKAVLVCVTLFVLWVWLINSVEFNWVLELIAGFCVGLGIGTITYRIWILEDDRVE